jgi:PRC-barrel domain
MEGEAFVRTYYVFRSAGSPGLYGFTDEPRPGLLPAEEGPWTQTQQIDPDAEWTLEVSRAVVAAGILENGFYLWGPRRPAPPRPIVESDRVEGTVVYGPDNHQIGTIKRLMIEKVSGRVVAVDVTFGGLFGVGTHHRTIPWDRLSYDTELEGYRTDITPEEVRGGVVGEARV